MLIQEPVHAAIWHCLNHYDYSDATFLSERLFNEVGSDESLHLLATCYYRSGKTNQAYNILNTQGARTPQNRFLLAKCCADLNKLSEAETLFFGDIGCNSSKDSLDDVITKFGDSASFALKIIANIFATTERGPQALDAERKVLKLNPFLWKSFENLCQRGDDPDPSKIFNISNVENFVQCHGLNPILTYANTLTTNQAAGVVNQPPSSTAPTIHHFAPHVKSGSVTSTPINVPAPSQNSQPAKQFLHPASAIEVTPQQQCGIPIPRLMMSMITPVHNQIETTLGNMDSCFTGSPVNDSSRLMSGIGALNMTTDCESTQVGPVPQAPHLGRRKRLPPLNSNISGNVSFLNATNARGPPVLNLNRFLGLENSSDRSEGNTSFGVLPHGTLSWSNQGVRLSQEPLNRGGVKLDFSSLAVLSPFPTPGQDGNSSVISSPLHHGQQAVNTALINSTNNEQKNSKRGLTESNSMKPNVFTPSSQNNSINLQNVTPLVSSGGVGTGGNTTLNTTGTNLVNNSSSIQNVRRSSRLFVSSQQSKSKENSKGVQAAPVKATRLLRSPSRKSSKNSSGTTTSNRFSSNPSVDLAAEKNEKNKEKLKKEKDLNPGLLSASTATLTPVSLMGQPSYHIISDQTSQMLNAQALVIQRHCVEGLLQLMRQLGSAFVELSRYNCRKAITILEDVPYKHQRSGWVLGHLGKAHFEQGQYKEAKRYFEEMRDIDPHRMEFMEYYSTTLWHLQEEVELSALAQELTRLDKFSPQAWCTAGNCFSHQKEHENSIKFFNRAIQVDPNFAYAYTLLGHEYVMIEELEKALSCFRAAVKVDPRHYNAWYGIGLTYYKQERFQLAEFYYRKAMVINPQSPILMCHVAVVQHALQKTDKALETLQRAITAAPQNPLCKFERASILFSSERYHEALQELNELKALAPKESPVYFLIGKVHNKLNNTHLALMHFSWAMDLDPKVANSQIKDALDPTLNRVAQEDSAPHSGDEALVVEDLEVGGVDQTEEDIIMMPDDSSNATFQDEINGSLRDGGPESFRSSTPPASSARSQHAFMESAPGASDESL